MLSISVRQLWVAYPRLPYLRRDKCAISRRSLRFTMVTTATRPSRYRPTQFFFGKHIYRLRTPLTANDPELVHRPRAGPTPRGAKRLTVQRRAWVLCRRIYQSAGSHYGPEALVRILLWAGFCLGLPELLSNHVWTLGPWFQRK